MNNMTTLKVEQKIINQGNFVKEHFGYHTTKDKKCVC